MFNTLLKASAVNPALTRTLLLIPTTFNNLLIINASLPCKMALLNLTTSNYELGHHFYM